MNKSELTIETTKREEWIDYLRGLGIILMIIGHTWIWPPVIKWIYGFHMPLFFVLSGYLFNKQKWEENEYRRFLYARFRNYIIPYFIWCVICFLMNLPIFCYSYWGDKFLTALVQNLGWIITNVKVDGVFLPQNCTPLWFLPCLFISQQIFYWLVRFRISWQWMLSLCFIAFNLFMNWFKMPIFPWHFEVALIGSVFMLVGYYFKETQITEKLTHPLIILVFVAISSIVILLNGSVDMYYRRYGKDLLVFIIASLLMCYSLIVLCKRARKLFHSKSVCSLGKFSIIVIGLNYTINRYTRLIYQILGKVIGWDLGWMEYFLPLTNLLICLFVISIYNKIWSRNKRFGILLGK